MDDQASAVPGEQEPDDGDEQAAREDELTCELGKWAAQVREHLARLQELGSPAPERRRPSRRPRRQPPQQ